MSGPSTTEAGKVGRPRSEKTRLAILEAAADLLEEGGLAGTTIESIAARAEVSKVTIYKWWPSRGSVAIDAYFHRYRQTIAFPDTGDVREDLTSQILATVAAFRGRAGEIMAELIGRAQSDPALAETLRTGWLQPRREVSTTVIQRGIDRGELRADVNITLLLDALYGPVYYRLVVRHEPLSDEFARELVATTLNGVRAAS
ncbi:MAG TPA: TetR/AcrR family transcriptional regulator [Acidimicrobiales bacterium]|jgi:AcrR family transcriptional regulator|nr:TetR/AcrR family transcriptional regulator [Acidimicrobiales bacterium]